MEGVCQACRVKAPTRAVTFYANTGLLVAFRLHTLEGDLCKRCVHERFWKMTGWSLAFGWWGTTSLVLNLFLILNNVARYAVLLLMPAAPGDPGSSS